MSLAGPESSVNLAVDGGAAEVFRLTLLSAAP